MYLEIKNPSVIHQFLKNKTYSGIPSFLYDKHLWFYSYIQQITFEQIYDKPLLNAKMFACHEGDAILGIALLIKQELDYFLYIDAISNDYVELFIYDVCRYSFRNVHIETIRPELTQFISKQIGYASNTGSVRLFTTKQAEGYSDNVIELNMETVSLLNSIPDDKSTYFHNMIERGYRSFAYVMGGRVISACALIMINAFRSEIISVDTFLDENKRKGYASAVCRVALNKALRNTEVVTWSTNASNQPSLMTAHALGFQPYYSVMENLISGELCLSE